MLHGTRMSYQIILMHKAHSDTLEHTDIMYMWCMLSLHWLGLSHRRQRDKLPCYSAPEFISFIYLFNQFGSSEHKFQWLMIIVRRSGSEGVKTLCQMQITFCVLHTLYSMSCKSWGGIISAIYLLYIYIYFFSYFHIYRTTKNQTVLLFLFWCFYQNSHSGFSEMQQHDWELLV